MKKIYENWDSERLHFDQDKGDKGLVHDCEPPVFTGSIPPPQIQAKSTTMREVI